mgnify:CR=1 FL=1
MQKNDKHEQHDADAAELYRVLRDYQTADGHCEITVRMQHGYITLIETTEKRKPPKINHT